MGMLLGPEILAGRPRTAGAVEVVCAGLQRVPKVSALRTLFWVVGKTQNDSTHAFDCNTYAAHERYLQSFSCMHVSWHI